MGKELPAVLRGPLRPAAGGLLNDPSQEGFDRLTRLAARVLGCPIALISGIEDQPQFLKSCFGLPEPWASQRQLPISASFCQQVKASRGVVAIEDLEQDPKLHQDPVVRQLGLAACLGVPLLSVEGEMLGTLCVFDTRPRPWTREEVEILQDLAVSVLSEIELRSSRARLAELLDAAHAEADAAREQIVRVIERVTDGFVALDTDWRLTYVNRKAAELLGRRREDLLGKHVWTEFPEVPGQSFYHAYRKAMAEQVFLQIEDHFAPWDRWFENRIYPSADGLSIFFRDVTEQKRAERRLHDSEVRLRLAAEASNIGFWDLEIESGTVHFSPEWKRQLGYEDSELEERFEEWETRLHPEDRERMSALLKAYWQRPWPDYEAEFRLRHKDGSYRWILTRAKMALDPEGKPLRMMGCHVDITERKRVEQALRQSEERYRHLVEMIPEAIGINRGGRIVFANPACLQLFGAASPEELLGRPGLELVHPDWRAAVQERIARMLESGEPAPLLEEKLRRLDGTAIDAEVTARPFQDGDATAILVVSWDIGTRKRSEREREELYAQVQRQAAELERRVAERTRQLEEINSELDAFAHSVSHDLRAPLLTMHGFAEALQEDYGERLEATGKDYCRRIVRAAESVDALIQDLLEYSRLSRAAIELRPVDLADLVDQVLARLDAELRRRRAQVQVRRPLPAVLGHAATLLQVVTNLVANAIKFVHPELRPQVQIRAEESGSRVRLWVEDNGIGIAPDRHERIFQPFERLHGAEAYPGTGIGLAVVRKGTERMGGSAGVLSRPGEGSRFWIELNRAEAQR